MSRLTAADVIGPNWFDYYDIYDQMVAEAEDGAVFVIVGVWFGRCIIHLCQTIERSGKPIAVHAVDTFTGCPNDPSQINYYAPLIKQYGHPFTIFKRNIEAAGVKGMIDIHLMTSTEGSALFADQSVDFVFVDADHSTPAVTADIQHWLPKIKKGGVLAGHDYHLFGVKAAVDAELGDRSRPASKTSWMCRVN